MKVQLAEDKLWIDVRDLIRVATKNRVREPRPPPPLSIYPGCPRYIKWGI